MDLVGFEPTTSSMPWKPDQSLTDNFLVVSCTYSRPFWTAFGPRDLFHAFLDPARTSQSSPVRTSLATHVLLHAHALISPFQNASVGKTFFPFLAL